MDLRYTQRVHNNSCQITHGHTNVDEGPSTRGSGSFFFSYYRHKAKQSNVSLLSAESRDRTVLPALTYASKAIGPVMLVPCSMEDKDKTKQNPSLKACLIRYTTGQTLGRLGHATHANSRYNSLRSFDTGGKQCWRTANLY